LRGVVFSITASMLFGALYYFVALLRPLDGVQVFGWRMLMMAPGLMLILTVYHAWPGVWALCTRLRREPRLRVVVLTLAGMLGLQVWLFVWAPLHGRALDVSMGFFLLPLSMALVGRVVLKERLSTLQTLAVVFAMLGVGHELWRTLAFSWATALVVLLYPPYFLLRRMYGIEALPGLFLETLLVLPVCLALLWWTGDFGLLVQSPRFLWQLPMLGVLSAAGLMCYLSAGRLLSMSLFGLLSYVEPVLLFAVATLLLGEAFAPAQWLTYGPIWAAVALLMVEGALRLTTSRRRRLSNRRRNDLLRRNDLP